MTLRLDAGLQWQYDNFCYVFLFVCPVCLFTLLVFTIILSFVNQSIITSNSDGRITDNSDLVPAKVEKVLLYDLLFSNKAICCQCASRGISQNFLDVPVLLILYNLQAKRFSLFQKIKFPLDWLLCKNFAMLIVLLCRSKNFPPRPCLHISALTG